MIFLFAFHLSSYLCPAQENDTLFLVREIPKNEVINFINSLKNKIIEDTSKFRSADLIISSIGASNRNSYSPLFILSKLYKYKLDIVSGKKVIEFTDEFLNANKINNIIIFNCKAGSTVYGDLGQSGVVLINIRKTLKINYFVSGFKMHTDHNLGGNNFKQWKLRSQKRHIIIHLG
jgi:hypothetical protein